MLRFWPWLAAIFSGVLLTLCFPRWDQAWLCWIALTPLIAAIWFGGQDDDPLLLSSEHENRSFNRLWRSALLGYVTGLVFFWGTFSWLTTVTGIGWFILAFYLALFPAAWGAFLGVTRRLAGDFTVSWDNILVAVAGAAAWVALEWMRNWGKFSFGWDGLGVALHSNLSLIQIVEFTGVGGLSFLVALTNLIVVITVRRFISEARAGRIRPHWDFSLNMALVAGVIVFGVRTVFGPGPVESGTPLTVAAVQANIPELEKRDLAFEKRTLERYTFLTETALACNPQLLVWPEAATPRAIFGDETNFNFVHNFAGRGDFNFLLGTLDFDEDDGGHDYNVAALLTDHGETIQTYRKVHLVPFGEFIPYRHSFPLFAWIVGDLVPCDLTPGKEPSVLHLSRPDLRVGTLVCFEDTLGDLTRRFVLKGAQFLVNITNDGWFQKSQGAEQHLANAVFRAVENRRPLLRVANTGVTALIDPLGRITHSLRGADGSPFIEGVLSDTMQIPPADARRTFYTRHGEVFSMACAWLSAATLLLAWRRRHR